MVKTYPLVSILILNWNRWKDTIECLESLYQINYPNYSVILIDNNSEDNSIEKIKEYCTGKLKIESEFFKYKMDNKPIHIFEYFNDEDTECKIIDEFIEISSNKKLMLIKNDTNYGFAEGNNIGIKHTLKNLDPDYVLLLNNDTVVDKEFLNEMINSMQKYPKIGFAGPKTYYYNYNGRKDVINFAGGHLNLFKGSTKHIGIGEIDKGQYDQIKKVDYVEGSCFLIKKEVLKEVGLLNNQYFAYWEENDLCMRGLKQNYSSLYIYKAKIWHKVSSSSKRTTTIYYLTRNRIWFIRKYASKIQNIVFFSYFFLFEFWPKSIYYVFYYQNKKLFHAFFEGIKDGIKTSK